MKRISALLLAILLVMTQSLAMAGATEASGKLVVGNPTQMQGYFFTELWGHSTSDIDVRMLLEGYNLVNWDGNAGLFMFDQNVVKRFYVDTTAAGDKKFTLTLQDDLYYSDGSKITAWDYAFSVLFQIAPELYEVGAKPMRKEHLVGFEEYLNGEKPYLAGVHVTEDGKLIFTLRKEYLPFFYELGLLLYNPMPIKVIAPGVVVKDDGKGVYLANEDSSVKDPVFTGELLKKTVMDPATGYLSHPSVVSGPYMLTSWDGVNAEFELNPYYKCDFYGNKPTIKYLTYTLADNNTMVEKLKNGEFGLLNKVTKADTIDAGLQLAEGADFEAAKYPRTGLTYISFACEKPTVASEAVRQAIAWSMDRDVIVNDYIGEYGVRVDGYYGIGQWMYRAVTHTMEAPFKEPKNKSDTKAMAEYQKNVDGWNALSMDGLTPYTLDSDKAAALLDQDGWTLNADGIREKEINGEKVTLDLKMIYPAGNKIAESFEANLIPNLQNVGIRLTLEPVEMSELLERFYKKSDRDFDMLYMGSNFDVVYDPSVSFVIDESGNPNWSYTNHTDEELYKLAVEMRQTEPGDAVEYVKRWVKFQQRFNQSLPMIPIYGNYYFDFYTADLQHYDIGSNIAWSTAINTATLAE